MKNSFKVTFLSLIFLSAYFVYGQKMAPPASPFIPDLLAEIDYVGNQVIQLADAMPQEKYSWRPSEEVRSISEVFMHIGSGDYFLLSKIGGSMPPDFKPEMEKSITQKTEVIAFLKKAFEDTKNFISKIKEEDLDKPVDFFGNKTNERRMLMLVLSHNSEHLGQSIAYARMNGVIPPWSQK